MYPGLPGTVHFKTESPMVPEPPPPPTSVPDKPGQMITLDHKGENTEKGQKERGAVQNESRSCGLKSFPGRSV